MQTYETAGFGSFQIKPLSPRLISAAGTQLKKEGFKLETLDIETSPLVSGELARQCLASWVLPDGTEPLKGLGPKGARDFLNDDPSVVAMVLSKAREQADEWAKRFEVVSGN